MALKECKLVFSGRVQGVGFRYTTHRIARDYPINGYVKNMRNGTVECLVSGEESDVDNFIGKVQELMSDNILKCDLEILNYSGSYKDFSIQF